MLKTTGSKLLGRTAGILRMKDNKKKNRRSDQTVK